MGDIWGIALIVGPILLLAAVIYAWSRNRAAGGASERQADRGARELRDEIEQEQDRNVDL